MNRPIAQSAFFLIVTTAILSVGGCGAAPPPVTGHMQVSEARSQKLMALAAREAGKIPDADMRLTRQLNLAEEQIESNWPDDARGTLAEARQTLGSPEAAKLNDQTRIGGWVSISELSRQIHDLPDAGTATDAALRELDKIEDAGKRCEYVMGIANELQYIKGKPAAAALLARAGPWTKWIDNLAAKRQALIAFATALFNLDDFASGQTMLEQETDAAWRSDTLASMSRAARDEQESVQAAYATRSLFPAADAAAPSLSVRSPNTQPFYGKQLEYNQLFRNRNASSPATKD